MRLAAIFWATCVLFSLVPNNLSQGEEPNMPAAQIRQWCPSRKQVFRGSCSEDGGQDCLNDLLSTWYPSVRLSPVYCDCIPHHRNKRLCNCPTIICP